MKILIVANYAKEHINKFHLGTIKKLKEHRNIVDVACRADADVPYCDHLFDVPCERNPFRIESLKCISDLRKLIEKNRYDIVHCHTLCGRIIGTIAAKKYKKYGLKIVVTCHGLNYYPGSSPFTKVLMPLDYYLMSKADLIFSNNQADIDYMRKHHYMLKKTVFCPPTINSNKFSDISESKEKRKKTRNTLGLKDDDIVLAYVAELNKNKNQEMLLDAAAYLIAQKVNVKLLLIGPDHSDGKIEKKADAMGLRGSVSFLGWRNDICDLLCASDIYAASSIREGYGVNLVEAAVCGLPIVASDNRGHREIIDNGLNGFLVPHNDPSKFAETVKTLIDNAVLREQIIRRMNEKVKSITSHSMADTILGEYQQLLSGE